RSLPPSKPLTGPAPPRRSVCAPGAVTLAWYRRPLLNGRSRMLFPSQSGRRQRGARRAPTNGLRRPQPLRPHLEILEDRLAPGDAVLGSLLASAFTGPCLVDWDSLSSPLGSSPNTGLSAKHRPLHPSVWSGLEGDRIGLVSALAPGPSTAEQPPRRDSA